MRRILLSALPSALCLNAIGAPAPERQLTAIYLARREALAKKLNGGIAALFAANEPLLEYQEYRRDEDFYYLTGWNEPGAALLLESAADAHGQAPARLYREVMLLRTPPTRSRRR